MRKSSGVWIVAGMAALLFNSAQGWAQDTEAIEYSDEEAAGDVEYSDEEAAGSSEVSAEGESDWSLSYGGEESSEGSEEESEDNLMLWEASAKEASSDDRAKLKPWEFGAMRHHSNLTGSTGLLRMQEAGSGPAGTFGFGVHGTYFKYSDYLIKGDENVGMWGDVNLRITPLDFLEIHYGIAASANYNNKEYPALFQTLGDMDLGIKGFYSFTKLLTLGLDFSVFMLNSVGEVALDWSGTSFGMDALATFDFAGISDDLPLRAHLKAGYFFDRAANLIEDIETDHGGCGADLDGDGNVEYAGCLSPVERTALGIDRNDQFRIGIGIDALLPYVSPMVEYNLEIPVNRQDFICPKDIPGSYDSCMVEESGSGFRQVLTIGARVLLPVEDLAIDLGVDIGLTGYAPTVHEMAAEIPYRIIFGASYNFDPFVEPPPPPPPPVVIEPPPPPPPPARVMGLVHDEESVDTPVSGAVVVYQGMELNAQVSGNDGRFISYELPEGTLTLNVSADGYNDGTFTVEIAETGDVEQSFPLKAVPKKGTIAVMVIDDKDSPMTGIDVKVKGPTDQTFTTDSDGKLEFDTDEGEHKIMIDVEGYLSKRAKVDAILETRTQVQIQLRPKPKKSLVVVKKTRIRIKRKIHFETDSDQIDPRSFGLLDEVADTLIRNPDIKLVEIQGHTDNRGKKDYNVDLSERRARSVRTYLADSGIERSRLQSKGFGPEKPIAPNVTRNGRARNRRVEFHIKERKE